MITLSISSGLLVAEFTRGEAVDEDATCVCEQAFGPACATPIGTRANMYCLTCQHLYDCHAIARSSRP